MVNAGERNTKVNERKKQMDRGTKKQEIIWRDKKKG